MLKNESPSILIIDDDPEITYSLGRVLSKRDYLVSSARSGEEGLIKAQTGRPDVIFLDNRMEGMTGLETLRRLLSLDRHFKVVLMTAFGTTQTAIEAMKLGAYDYIVKPFDQEKLLSLAGSAILAGEENSKALAEDTHVISPEDYKDGIVGNSELMREIYKTIGQVAPTDVTVLITGESGTGKELVARCIHNHSLRSRNSFLAVNCAAIPENLIESELFGHEKGAFTGAASMKKGKFELCDEGSIFLDEIGDMTPVMQTKLLRILQDGELQRVGATQTLRVDVRLIAATNKDLEEMVADGRFREDLYYRLNVVRIRMPALRERLEDIPELVDFMLHRITQRGRVRSRRISRDAKTLLLRHTWPGNVRELENIVHHSVVVSQGETILPRDLPADFKRSSLRDAVELPTTQTSRKPVEAEEILGGNSVEEPRVMASNRTGPGGAGEPPMAAPEEIRPPRLNPDDAYDAVYSTLREETDEAILRTLEEAMIRRVLKETGGNQVKASRLLGITRATLRKRIVQYSIRY